MLTLLKQSLFTLTINSSLFLLLIIGIQNSDNRSKVKLIIGETVILPISFIVGTSFISGSIVGSLVNINLNHKKKVN
tara:strand:+ start:93 stop:323 length:231 start_codon:yes stop_codon:yes gene_type:complete